MKEDLYKNSKACEPSGLSPEAIRQYYWEQGFKMAKEIKYYAPVVMCESCNNVPAVINVCHNCYMAT
jgi:hypothetical protein